MHRFPAYPQRRRLVLDSTWHFSWLGDVDIDNIKPAQIATDDIAAVPGCFDTAGILFGRRGVALYRKQVTFPAGLTRLTFGGLGLYARIFVDNREIGLCLTPYATLNFDLELQGDSHTLEVLLDNRYDNPQHTPVFYPFYDFYGYGGIYRSVTLESLPDFRLERVKVDIINPKAGEVRLEIRLGGTTIPDQLSFSYYFDQASSSEITLPVTGNKVVFDAVVPHPQLWSLAAPNLHTVTVSTATDCIIERFGLRTLTTKGQQILLNDQPIRLFGVNRHESHPNFGPVQPTQIMVDDVKWLKELGANFVRGAHYQMNSEFLECCDEAGILIWHESLAWGLREHILSQPLVEKCLLESTRIVAQLSLNHPAVLCCGFLNECASDTEAGRVVYEKLVATIRQEDPTRLISYASNQFEKDLCFDLVDIISVNPYPGWITNLDRSGSPYYKSIQPYYDQLVKYFSQEQYANKPLLISEAGACGVWGKRDRARAQWSEEFQADYFSRVTKIVLGNSRFVGITLWQFLDCRSFVNTFEIRSKPFGYNLAGLLDEYRRPKLAFDAVKELFHSANNNHL